MALADLVFSASVAIFRGPKCAKAPKVPPPPRQKADSVREIIHRRPEGTNGHGP
jgi:hypothetical protein